MNTTHLSPARKVASLTENWRMPVCLLEKGAHRTSEIRAQIANGKRGQHFFNVTLRGETCAG